jgi:hypothetical protein
MAATGFTPISLYYTTTASAAPTAGNLVAGELAINTTDGKLFYKDTAGTVQVIGTKGGVGSSSTTQVLYNNAGTIAGSSSFVFDGTNVGIGGAPSGAKLDISGSGAINTKITSSNSSAQLILNSAASSVSYIVYGQTGANPLAFYDSNAAAERIRIDSSGKVGIGTNSPQSTLSVVCTSASRQAQFGDISGFPAFLCRDTGGTSVTSGFWDATQQIFTNAGTERMRIDGSGNVGIGTSSPGAKLMVYATGGASISLNNASTGASAGTGFQLQGGNSGDAYIWNYSNNFTVFATNNTERMRISADGNLLIGTTSANGVGWTITPAGGGQVRGSGTGSSDRIQFANANGVVGAITTSGTTTAYNTSSDYRLKENIAPMTSALSRVSALKPVTYKWKVDGSNGEGFIAHELQAVVPDCVTGEKDAVDAEGKPQYQGIDTSFLVATLVAAIQELKAEVDALKGVK